MLLWVIQFFLPNADDGSRIWGCDATVLSFKAALQEGKSYLIQEQKLFAEYKVAGSCGGTQPQGRRATSGPPDFPWYLRTCPGLACLKLLTVSNCVFCTNSVSNPQVWFDEKGGTIRESNQASKPLRYVTEAGDVYWALRTYKLPSIASTAQLTAASLLN